MSKKDKKRKQKRQESDEYTGGGGLLTSMRGGFKSMAGQGGKDAGRRTGLKKAWDVVFWIVIAALAGLAFYRYAGRR
jgi:hypothetical protein